MSNKTRQVYTRAFKCEVIELAHTSGKPVTELVPRGTRYLTYISTAEGWLYLASAIDLFWRKLVG